ncbi:MAG: cobyrinate a,c-diamide synthase, partial [Peptococcaceae bacterium]|nr:cobyrinate a,c-diamide synthase [Peptococcaceae bacterium]
FKVGPDYIDPSYHTGATGRTSRNLDSWLLHGAVEATFAAAVQTADIAVIEGVMGLFDGIKGQRSHGSSAEIASLVGAPVILIIDVRAMAYSAAALVYGFAHFDPAVKLAGVILNRVGSASHLNLVKDAIEALDIPVLGGLGKECDLTLPERHLGLVPLSERGNNQAYFAHLAQVMARAIDLDRLLELAGRNSLQSTPKLPPQPANIHPVRLAVARDEAFSFYYQDTLDLLTKLGAVIIPFSPLHDTQLPAAVDGIIIGGGFPESFLTELTGNTSMLQSIRAAHAQGKPIYAECGGLMYLCQEICSFEGESYAAVGIIPAQTSMQKRLQGMGYRTGIMQCATVLGPMGTVVKGHEFHYSATRYAEGNARAYQIAAADGADQGLEGYVAPNLLASYLHLNLAGQPELAEHFIAICRANREVGLWES